MKKLALPLRRFTQLVVIGLAGLTSPANAGSLIAPETIEITAGVFLMGSDRPEREAAYRLDEKAYGHSRTRQWKWYEDEPQSKPRLGTYSITKNLISNKQYGLFIKDTGHPAPNVSEKTWRGYKLAHPYQRTRKFAWISQRPPQGREDHPVVLLAHTDAVDYAQWLSSKTGTQWRLPTEAEWEKAARGTDGRAFPWGPRFSPSHLNSHDKGPFDTVPVGNFPAGASPFGLFDAAGQVFEWTATAAGKNRFIVKGGSWDDKGCGVCRPAARHTRPAELKHILVGFRLVTTER